MRKCLNLIHFGGTMNRLFEPVYFEPNSLFWDYKIRNDHDFKGYYHWHQCCEILFVHEGQGTVVVNQQTYDIRRGMFFFFHPYQLHQIHADVSPERPYIRSIFYIDPLLVERQLRAFPNRHTLFAALWQGKDKNHAYDLHFQAEIMEWIYELYEKARGKGKTEYSEESTMLLLQILSCLSIEKPFKNEQVSKVMERRTLRYSETIMRWIEDHFQEEVSLEHLAEETHLSKNYVSRIFHQETGSSITDYLTARRIKEGCRLLETTTLPVEEIGIRIGFSNVSYFVQLFKKVVGTTPLQYRNKL
jgi:AraC-like DNA-binding protein